MGTPRKTTTSKQDRNRQRYPEQRDDKRRQLTQSHLSKEERPTPNGRQQKQLKVRRSRSTTGEVGLPIKASIIGIQKAI
jgi:hypothetical protein